ncbi:MAG: transporter substrate-binding protein [Deltaproteobacteria bacterium]|nr:transporter substrate-binding protein [Deltaproteobacteria bacterium]
MLIAATRVGAGPRACPPSGQPQGLAPTGQRRDAKRRRYMRNIILVALAAAFIATILTSRIHAGEPPYKVRIGYPSSAVSTLPFDIAKEKGFYTKAGLDVEYIQMRSALGPQAILNGNIHFFTSPQSAINAAVAGLPLVVVLSLYRDTPWVLVTNREINRAQDLLGKRIAISDIRSSPYYFARAGFKKLAIEEKQISLITTGGTSNSFATLTTHQVAGAVLSPPFDEKAVSLGYKKFLFLGDLADIPYVGLFTSQAEIRGNRERIRRTIGAVMDAAAWQRANRSEAVKMIASRYKISQSEAERSYDTMTGILSPDGAMNMKKVRGYLNLLREERPIPEDLDPAKLVDFSMLPSAR